ncbi:hypothetical protein FXO38_07560 [Capsicum annuum]|nr:hypothetical protein FXO37_29247 [Capsicum annuum]KAF3669489.1 hypothetical protein FXO38_07560 [Capsicum annuum]
MLAPVVLSALTTMGLLAIADDLRHLWKKRKNRKLKRVLTRSMSIGVLHGGELALQRLVDYHEAKANLRSLDSTEIELELDALLNEERPDFKKLQVS